MNGIAVLLLGTFLLMAISLTLGGCIESERDALLTFKNGLTDPSNRLADWVAESSDCCTWTGVVCHNITAHVIELHLRTLSEEEYFGPDQFFKYHDPENKEYEQYKMKSAFGGKVSSSLLHLKYLSYLELRNNDFGGIPIPEFFGSMQSLRYLDLFQAGFGGMNIPPQLGNLSNLHYLNLHEFNYYREVPNLSWISGLSSLEFLDLSYADLSQSLDWLNTTNSLPHLVELHLSRCSLSDFNPLPSLNFSSLSILDLSGNGFGVPILNALQNMTYFVKELDLSDNDLNSSIPSWIYGLSLLQYLYLDNTLLRGQISTDIRNLTCLVTLGLSGNDDFEFDESFLHSIKSLCNLKSFNLPHSKMNLEINHVLEILSSGCISDVLESLDFGFSHNLTGHLTDQIGHLKKLKHLDLSGNVMIRGPIPASFKRLCNLKSLSLSGAKLSQDINDVLAIMSECVSDSLQSLNMDDCQLSGHLTNDLCYFKNLTFFKISENLISGPIPRCFGDMISLVYTDLSNNSLNGTLPISFGELNKLEQIYISSNRLEGEVFELHFANLVRLTSFDASGMGKNISLKVSPNWIPPLQLQILLLGSWNIVGSQFPTWLRLLKHLEYLDLSDTGISTSVPTWFWDSLANYYFLSFSHNHMQGSIPSIPSINGKFSLIDLSSNNFSGEVPIFSANILALDLSNNSFSGDISNFLCYKMNTSKKMDSLNFAGNQLSGEIPNCWNSWENLMAIKLSNNKFSGNIPDTIGALTSLQSLQLRNNNLSGEIPVSLENCSNLATLDLSGNNLVGDTLAWVGAKFSSLRILSLRGNKFDGYLPKELCLLASLHILDLAHNNFSGTIPTCFNNFTAMALRNDSVNSFQFFPYDSEGKLIESISLVMEGRAMEYSTILRLVRSIDLSSNNLSGEIPIEITSIVGLLSLNLSWNGLTGRIPGNIGDMKGLEAIDFSHNELSGEIPHSMTRLTFLSTLDLSYNNLSGRIPSGTQLQSFNSSSFIGNQLCGPPLAKNCSSDGAQPTDDEEKDENGNEVDVWFYASMSFGFVVGFWSVVSSLIFVRKWRHFYFRTLNILWNKIWWSCFRTFR